MQLYLEWNVFFVAIWLRIRSTPYNTAEVEIQRYYQQNVLQVTVLIHQNGPYDIVTSQHYVRCNIVLLLIPYVNRNKCCSWSRCVVDMLTTSCCWAVAVDQTIYKLALCYISGENHIYLVCKILICKTTSNSSNQINVVSEVLNMKIRH